MNREQSEENARFLASVVNRIPTTIEQQMNKEILPGYSYQGQVLFPDLLLETMLLFKPLTK